MKNEADSLCKRGASARAMGIGRDGDKNRGQRMLEQAEAKVKEAQAKEQTAKDSVKREDEEIGGIKRLAKDILDISRTRGMRISMTLYPF